MKPSRAQRPSKRHLPLHWAVLRKRLRAPLNAAYPLFFQAISALKRLLARGWPPA
jgi:hypothetical protein